MGAVLREQNLGPMRWLVVSGEASDCFRTLGGHMRAEIREAVTEWTPADVFHGLSLADEPSGRRGCPRFQRTVR